MIQMELLRATSYRAEAGAIIGTNLGRYNNRPLYANHRNDVVLGWVVIDR